GGARLAKELRGFGGTVAEEARRHHRICTLLRPAAPAGIAAALEAGAPRHIDNLALCSQPGIFSWDRLDPGTALLLRHLPALSGRGADFGCGIGVLSLAVLRAPKVAALALIDIDRRAVAMARRNVDDPRASHHWADLRGSGPALSGLDFVVTNPPFHDGGAEDQALGKAFIARAAASLRNGGTLVLVANAHLPYEAPLRAAFRTVTETAKAGGYKLFEARK
ncbi:class I SAM-dependent methyltransferase, partial [Methylobacterium sp. Leaf118]|uniref:class I SAM-dependent methyltransferase n=1 Tax=Methylobacterium sp. Leaf118 TaxID=2876562 RepID=UPI001E64FD5A